MSSTELPQRARRKPRHYAPSDFISFAKPKIFRLKYTERRWKEHFGATPEVCAKLWNLIDPYLTMPNAVQPKHLLWSLVFLKQYNTESNTTSAIGEKDEKTYRKWAFLFVDAISYLESRVIIWGNRFANDIGNQCLISVDGTDMRTHELSTFSKCKRFYSHKFRSAGLRYEVGICILSGDIVWINGPFRCGMNDLTIARQALVGAMEEGEKAEADRGYEGEHRKIKTPSALHVRSDEERRMKQNVRSRHETVNERIKNFNVMRNSFRKKTKNWPVKHSACFRAVAVITQLSIEDGERLFDVDYKD